MGLTRQYHHIFGIGSPVRQNDDVVRVALDIIFALTKMSTCSQIKMSHQTWRRDRFMVLVQIPGFRIET